MKRVSVAWIFPLLTFSVIALRMSFAKPFESSSDFDGSDPATIIAYSSNPSEEDASLLREKRFPQYGFSDYDDYSFEPSGRHFKNKHKHKPTHVHVPIATHGCRGHGHDCGGSHHKPSSAGGSFASASAGSFGGGNHGGSNSQAQSASLSFGPFSISTAQAQSFSRGDGGYGNFGGFDY